MLCYVAAALLAGCGGGSGTPLSPLAAGFTPGALDARLTYSVLHNFGAAGDGSDPVANLIDVKGTLYGTTAGTSGSCYLAHCGTVFAVTTSGIETVLYTFGTLFDGATPKAGLVDGKGVLYGTTYKAGYNGVGTVFEITAPERETTLYSFRGNHFGGGALFDGAYPAAGLVDIKGKFYGTTDRGGANGSGGTVFVLTTSGAENVIHSFGGAEDGKNPQASLVSAQGTIYGTTATGGEYFSTKVGHERGTVFSITTTGIEKVLHSFGSPSDGLSPQASLIYVNGTLYGTTYEGGARGTGTVFSITPTGTEKVLHSFGSRSDGANPEAALIYVNGVFYGTTAGGGAYGKGTIFKISLSGNEKVLHSFGYGSDGATPLASLLDKKGTLYGTTSAGGTYGYGTVFKMTPR